MPVALIAEGNYHPAHFELEDKEGETTATTSTTAPLRRPKITNWGYDIVIYGFGGTNAAILKSGRPDELVDFISTLHTLPEPMTVTFDIALGHADDAALVPWDFVCDTDDTWNVKVVGEAAYFVDWRIPAERYENPEHFSRLNDLGIDNREALHSFVHALAAASEVTDYDLETMAAMLSTTEPLFGDGDLTPDDLEDFALAWMRNVAEFCSLANWTDDLDPDRTAFDFTIRQFRHERP